MLVAFCYKLKPKQWRTVGVADTFYNFNISKIYLWIDSLSQSWTNPMHLFWAYGLQALSQSCLPLVWLWDCKFVTAPKFMYGYLRTCSCDVFPWSRSISDAKIFCFGFVLWEWLFKTKIFAWWSPCVDMVLLEFPFTSYFENCSQQPLYVL